MTTLRALTRACVDNGSASARVLLDEIMDRGWVWLQKHIRQMLIEPSNATWSAGPRGTQTHSKSKSDAYAWFREPLPAGRLLPPGILEERMTTTQTLWAFIQTARIAPRATHQAQVVETLKSLPIQVPLGVLHAAQCSASPPPDLADLHAYCTVMLTLRLARADRAPGDWTIGGPNGCTCELCTTLAGFLTVNHERRLGWPLAEARRRHIHDVLDRNQLPVRHVTRRSGRPYTLVLEKTEELFHREASERAKLAEDLVWLTRPRKRSRRSK